MVNGSWGQARGPGLMQIGLTGLNILLEDLVCTAAKTNEDNTQKAQPSVWRHNDAFAVRDATQSTGKQLPCTKPCSPVSYAPCAERCEVVHVKAADHLAGDTSAHTAKRMSRREWLLCVMCCA